MALGSARQTGCTFALLPRKSPEIVNLSVTVLDLAGSIALLLWAIHMAQTGIQRAFGAGLRIVPGPVQNRFKAFLAGLVVTAVLHREETQLMLQHEQCGYSLAGGFNKACE